MKTIGLSTVPAAFILPPRSIIRAALETLSPLITVPGSIVNVALFNTLTYPLRTQTLSAVSVLFAVMSPDMVSGAIGSTSSVFFLQDVNRIAHTRM